MFPSVSPAQSLLFLNHSQCKKYKGMLHWHETMDPQFTYLTPSDLEWSLEKYPLLMSPLSSLALRQFTETFTSAILSFPQFHEPGNPEESRESPESIEFLDYARSVLEEIPGHVGETVTSQLLAKLDAGIATSDEKIVRIKPSVLIAIFGSHCLTSLSLTLPCSLHNSVLNRSILDTVAFKCANLKELSLNLRYVYTCDERTDHWRPLEKLTSLDSLILTDGMLPYNWDLTLTLKSLILKRIVASPYKILALLLRPEYKTKAIAVEPWTTHVWLPVRSSPASLGELMNCAQSEGCVLPFCRTLTKLVVEQNAFPSIWTSSTAAFLLLACPNLKSFETNVMFPYGQAVKLLKNGMETAPRTFDITQLYTVLELQENVKSVIQATPHTAKLEIQGASDDGGSLLMEDVTMPGLLLHRLMDAVGEKAAVLPVTLKGFNIMFLEDFGALSVVRRLRLEESSMLVKYAEENSRTSPENQAVLQNLKRLVIDGCLTLSPSGEKDLLSQCPNLEELFLQCVHFCSTGKQLVKFARRHWQKLKVFFLKTEEEITWDFDDVIALVNACPELRVLTLPHSFLECYLDRETFTILSILTEKRGVELRFGKPHQGKLYCEEELDDW